MAFQELWNSKSITST